MTNLVKHSHCAIQSTLCVRTLHRQRTANFNELHIAFHIRETRNSPYRHAKEHFFSEVELSASDDEYNLHQKRIRNATFGYFTYLKTNLYKLYNELQWID